MTNHTNYSYGTIPGTVDNDADHGEKNTTTKKDETVRMRSWSIVSRIICYWLQFKILPQRWYDCCA